MQSNASSSHILLKEFVPIYLEISDKWHSPSTQVSDRSLLYNKKHGIATSLGECRLENIKMKTLQLYIDEMEGLSSKTKFNYLMLISAMLEMAKKLEYIDFIKNPAKDVIVKKTKPKERVPYNKQQIEHSGTLEVENPLAGLTTEELRKLADDG